ncbi:tetratricopeptide repeat protein [Candidatus Odyssella thessalonicensis]|uniref:tetratricopeptide repeat protein n=1 Tax=Candidatus Odyssella thessalonicensis TaxID=84647 RepID=UPI000225B6D0|nr:SEL1-like repeat protein [Candidatus Odyssella thessalonicensis]
MRSPLYLSLLIYLCSFSLAQEMLEYKFEQMLPEQAEALKHYIDSKPFVPSINLDALRDKAVTALYSQETRNSSLNFLIALSIITQDGQAIIAAADFLYHQEMEVEKSISLYKYALILKDNRSIYPLARLYGDPSYSGQDLSLSHKYFKLGAELNLNNCLCALAQHYLAGTYSKPDPQAAFLLLQQSALTGFALAATELATLLNDKTLNGQPDPVHAYEIVEMHRTNDNRAEQIARNLERNSLVQAYKNKDYLIIANAYRDGKKLPLNKDRAQYFYHKAASQQNRRPKGQQAHDSHLINSSNRGPFSAKVATINNIIKNLF